MNQTINPAVAAVAGLLFESSNLKFEVCLEKAERILSVVRSLGGTPPNGDAPAKPEVATPFEKLVLRCESDVMTCADKLRTHGAINDKAALIYAIAVAHSRALEEFRVAGGGWPTGDRRPN